VWATSALASHCSREDGITSASHAGPGRPPIRTTSSFNTIDAHGSHAASGVRLKRQIASPRACASSGTASGHAAADAKPVAAWPPDAPPFQLTFCGIGEIDMSAVPPAENGLALVEESLKMGERERARTQEVFPVHIVVRGCSEPVVLVCDAEMRVSALAEQLTGQGVLARCDGAPDQLGLQTGRDLSKLRIREVADLDVDNIVLYPLSQVV
jgi:hypothetical protein